MLLQRRKMLDEGWEQVVEAIEYIAARESVAG